MIPVISAWSEHGQRRRTGSVAEAVVIDNESTQLLADFHGRRQVEGIECTK